jgi:transposase InsO family protein
MTAQVRRRHLKAKFDQNAPPSTMLPRQDYGIDFYSVYNGEIMVIVDLFTRETMLTHLNRRTQDNVAQTILNVIIFQRGVPRSLRTDNAPELSSLTGAVSAICEYRKISQIRTGGHNPRGNSICERVNQSIGSMIRKLSDQEYKHLKRIVIPAFQFALNTTFNSAIGCTPFKAGHGLQATTVAQARLQTTRHATTAEGGRDGDALEDVDAFFDQGIIKEQLELAVRTAEVVRSTSEWHRRMTAENLSQSGQAVDLEKYTIGHKDYVYKPPSMNETIARGRRAKHIDHYVGPGFIIKHIGTRSIVVRTTENTFREMPE